MSNFTHNVQLQNGLILQTPDGSHVLYMCVKGTLQEIVIFAVLGVENIRRYLIFMAT